MTTVQDTLSTARHHLHDSNTPYRWSDERLISALDECLAFLTSSSDYFTTQGFVQNLGDSSFNLQGMATKLLRIYDSKSGRKVSFINRDKLDRDKPAWRKDTGSEIRYIVVDKAQPLWFWLYPRIVDPDDTNTDCEGIITSIDDRITNIEEFMDPNRPLGSELCKLNIIYVKQFDLYLPKYKMATTDDMKTTVKDMVIPMITPDLLHAIGYYISGTAYNDQSQAGSQNKAITNLQLYQSKIDAIMSRGAKSTADVPYNVEYNPFGVNY